LPKVGNLHAGGANRHAGHGDPRHCGALGEQPCDLLGRYMSFN
jgi:hypothetical protein